MPTPEYPTNFEFHKGAWQPVKIRGKVDGYLVGHENEIISKEQGFGHPTPPPGMVLVMTENGLVSVHESFVTKREET